MYGVVIEVSEHKQAELMESRLTEALRI